MVAGKMLGGSSSLQAPIYFKGNPREYERWAEAANDRSWNYDGLKPYFTRSERLEDPELLNSPSAQNYGTLGNIALTREPKEINKGIVDAFAELGVKPLLDQSGSHTLGTAEGLFDISLGDGTNGVSQNTAVSYLSPAKDRSNLFVFYHTTVTKILFDDNKNAVGVEVQTADGKTFKVNALKEVVLAAGVFKTPQLLLLSGVGPKTYLKSFDIPLVSDLPVGLTLQDHPCTVLFYKLGKSNTTMPPANPHKLNSPLTVSNVALNPAKPRDDIQSINLIFPRDPLSAGITQFCSTVIRYKNDICDKLAHANTETDIVMFEIYKLQPLSYGKVALRTKNALDDPWIFMGYFQNASDLDDLSTYLKEFSTIVNTTYFKSVDAERFNFDLKECDNLDNRSLDYYRCYTRVMSATVWHPLGTAPMGAVLDSKLNVRGVQNLRVVDAAGIPSHNSGKLFAAVVVFAEKASDLIKADWSPAA